MLNRKWYQASKPEMEFHMINIIYAALPMHTQTKQAQSRLCKLGPGTVSIFYMSNIHLKIYPSRLCMKMSSFLFVRTWAMPRTLYLSCGILFPVWTPDNISGLTSVVVWLSRWEVIKTGKAEQGHTRVPSKSFPYIPSGLKVWSLGDFFWILILWGEDVINK